MKILIEKKTCEEELRCFFEFRLENLELMFNTGFYINDLSMHDSSRDLVLVGTQQSAELKLALDQEKTKVFSLSSKTKILTN